MPEQFVAFSKDYLSIFLTGGSEKIYHARLMSEQLVIDGQEFARNRKTLHGKISVAGLERVRDQLFSDEGELEYTVHGEPDADGNPLLHLTIVGTVQLCCQRCLGRLAFPLELKSWLCWREMSPNWHVAERRWISASLPNRGSIPTLLEDEILLRLPVSPRHPEGECQAGNRAPTGAATDSHPFAALAALKKRDSI